METPVVNEITINRDKEMNSVIMEHSSTFYLSEPDNNNLGYDGHWCLTIELLNKDDVLELPVEYPKLKDVFVP